MTKSSINCPYCNNEIVLEYSKVKATKSKKKKEPIIVKVHTMNDYASVLEVKKMDDLVLTSLAYFYFTKQTDKVSYGDLYKSMKNADNYFNKMKGKPKEAVIRLVHNKKIEEHPNQMYSLSKSDLKRIGKAIKK